MSSASPAKSTTAPTTDTEGTLIVGNQIKLKARMTKCDTLVVEGLVEANMAGRRIQVGAGGTYEGSAEVAEADIEGNFEGDLSVTGTLKIGETGRVRGTIRYGRIVIAEGGVISGNIETLDDETVPSDRVSSKKSKPAAQEKVQAVG